jgi:hypothetical protein
MSHEVNGRLLQRVASDWPRMHCLKSLGIVPAVAARDAVGRRQMLVLEMTIMGSDISFFLLSPRDVNSAAFSRSVWNSASSPLACLASARQDPSSLAGKHKLDDR